MNPKFSFIIPCYGSQDTIAAVIEEIKTTLRPEDSYEIILINDCSPDGVQPVIDSLCAKDKFIRSITFARNFGKHSAVLAGIRRSLGEYVCLMDDDGQCPFPQFYRLFDAIERGAHIAMAYYGKKKQSAFKNFGSAVNNLMANLLIGKPKDLQLTNFVLLKRFVRDEIVRYTGPYPYIDGLLLRASRNIASIPMEDRLRIAGESSFTFKKMLLLWLNGFTSFSVVPLRVSILFGLFFSGIGFVYAAYIIISRILNPEMPIVGWSSLMAAVLFMGGLILCMLGMIGEYVGRIFISLNNSPQYVIEQMKNFEGSSILS